ncbi:MAG: hypothetical protein U9N52_07965 [Campylobacterota bacterium]|nr:hypothetical protein [Campylobacterota bacterium]
MPYHRIKLYVGMFVSLFILSIGILFYVIMEKKGFFEEHVNFFFKTSNASNFFVGMPLNISGFEIGSITHIELTDAGEVKITFRVKQSHHKWICEDTQLMLEKPLLGSPTISVMTSLGYKKLKNGSQLTIILRDDINDIIVNLQPILGELQQIIHSVNTITNNLASKDGSLEKTLYNLEHFSAKLSSDEALLNALTGDRNSTKALNKSLQRSDKVFKDIEHLTLELTRLLQTVQQQVVTPVGKSMVTIDAIFIDIKKKLDALDNTVIALGSYDSELLLLKKELHYNLDKTHQLLEKVDAMLIDSADQEVKLP